MKASFAERSHALGHLHTSKIFLQSSGFKLSASIFLDDVVDSRPGTFKSGSHVTEDFPQFCSKKY